MRTNPRHRTLTLIVLVGALLGQWAHAERPVWTRPSDAFLVGADISGLAKIEQLGGVFREEGTPGDAVSILTANGCNCFRLRLFVNPNHENLVVNDLEYTLALAKRIRRAGQSLMLDLHYSDTWADPGKQYTPAAWSKLDFEQLRQQVRRYSEEVLSRFKEQGVLPDIVQVGNEVTNGMLWPQGKIHYGDGEAESWARFTSLLEAGIEGVRAGAGEADGVKVLIHIDRGCDWPATEAFYSRLEEAGVRFDMIGLSYYPWWHGDLEDLGRNIQLTAKRFKKPIVLVETGYPHRGSQWAKRPHMNWPVTQQGQAEFLRDVVRTVKQAPNGLGVGVLYWYPEAIPVDGLHIWEGGSVGLFGSSGELLPAAQSFHSGFPSNTLE